MSKAFDGIRVIDFTQVVSGPVATANLALLGADVIKLELRGSGDQTRNLMAEGEWALHGLGPIFVGCNFGKRSIAIDLKNAAAKKVVRRLLESADIVVENFKPGVMARLGFSYGDVRAIKPDIIYCSISGFGQNGPAASAGAYDGAIQAISGLMSLTGTPEAGPIRSGFPLADMATSMNASFAIAAALYRRATTGKGQYLDVAMTDTVMALISIAVNQYLLTGKEPVLMGNHSATMQTTTDIFETTDGAINISVFTDHLIPGLCRGLGRPEWAEAERYKTERGRVDNRLEVLAEMSALLKTQSSAHWVENLRREGIPVAPVLTVPQALAEEQVGHREVMMTMPAPAGIAGEITVPGLGFMASEDGPGTTTPAPTLGQHTEEILREFGYGAAEIASLKECGAI
jgi:CoA:oxalate CoA-transferase